MSPKPATVRSSKRWVRSGFVSFRDMQGVHRPNSNMASFARKARFPVVILVVTLATLPATSQLPSGTGTNSLQVAVRGADNFGSGTNAVQVVVRETEKSTKLKEVVEVFVGIATFFTVLYGLYTAFKKFKWSREECTFLRIELDAKVIRKVGDLVLATITIRLENKGQTRISARKTEHLPYDDGFDVCRFPGTLKIRPFPAQDSVNAFDWYSLKPAQPADDDFEQINYLDEFQGPRSKFKESDFWLEPNECSESQVPVWLKPGGYAIKAFFLGKETEPSEEEYWSVTKFLYLDKSNDKLAYSNG